MRVRPASASGRARFFSMKPLVVRLRLVRPGIAARRATSSGRPGRRVGSPPVRRISVTPWPTKIRASRSISSKVRSASRLSHCSPSSGMQYTQRKLQRSVSEIRRSPITRPKESVSRSEASPDDGRRRACSICTEGGTPIKFLPVHSEYLAPSIPYRVGVLHARRRASVSTAPRAVHAPATRRPRNTRSRSLGANRHDLGRRQLGARAPGLGRGYHTAMRWESELVRWVQGAVGRWWTLDATMRAAARWGSYAEIALWLSLLARGGQRRTAGAAWSRTALALGVASALVLALRALAPRARPFVAGDAVA